MLNYLTEMLKKLTDNYAKDTNSNIGKLFNLISSEIEELDNTFTTIENYRDIDRAQGDSLDRIGVNVQQFRGAANDEAYRILLKSKIARNQSTGDINKIIEILSIALNANKSNIYIDELYDDSVPEAAAIQVNVPIELLNNASFSITQFGRLVNRIVATGVRANVINQGTFSFSSQLGVSETDVNAGFADLAQTKGGTLGIVYDPGNDIDLPLD